jgi:hypothetical protein
VKLCMRLSRGLDSRISSSGDGSDTENPRSRAALALSGGSLVVEPITAGVSVPLLLPDEPVLALASTTPKMLSHYCPSAI